MAGGSDIGSLRDGGKPQPAVALPLELEQVETFHSYELSSSDVPFSSGHLAAITIGQCAADELQIPAVLPEGTLKFLGWSRVVPEENRFLLMGTSIPCLKDVRLFLGETPEAYIKGYRSVVIEVKGTYANGYAYHTALMSCTQ